MKHLVSLQGWSRDEILAVLDLADRMKASPEAYRSSARQKVLMMIFEKPSLRTRVSFETGMAHLGGHAIYYDMYSSPMGAGKETIHDTVKTVSRYVDLISARLFEHDHLVEMAENSGVPVINALTNFSHPCQILADMMTIREQKGRLEGVTLCYLGDSNNNVTHSLMYGCAILGLHMNIGCPSGAEFEPQKRVVEESGKLAEATGSRIAIVHDAREAARGADVVYTDTWMSYHIPKEEQDRRVERLMPYQVTARVMQEAAMDAVFMNCLPARRGFEQTAEVIDGPRSVVFEEAENRMHAQNAVMLTLLDSVPEPA